MNSIQNENNAIQRHVRFVKWRRDPGAVQTEFKVILYSDFASRFKRHRNKAELFILLNISVVVSSNIRFHYFAFKIKEEFVMRSSPQSGIVDSRAIPRVTDLTTYHCILINLLL